MQSREIIGEDRGIERKREREERINLLTHNERERKRKDSSSPYKRSGRNRERKIRGVKKFWARMCGVMTS